jgi:hypothetical protein
MVGEYVPNALVAASHSPELMRQLAECELRRLHAEQYLATERYATEYHLYPFRIPLCSREELRVRMRMAAVRTLNAMVEGNNLDVIHGVLRLLPLEALEGAWMAQELSGSNEDWVSSWSVLDAFILRAMDIGTAYARHVAGESPDLMKVASVLCVRESLQRSELLSVFHEEPSDEDAERFVSFRLYCAVQWLDRLEQVLPVRGFVAGRIRVNVAQLFNLLHYGFQSR